MLRFFAGLDQQATAEIMGLSERTIRRDCLFSKAKLHGLLADSNSNESAASD